MQGHGGPHPRDAQRFAFSGLTVEEVTQLRDQHHIYCTMDGRISMAGVTNANVEYIATSIHDVITK
jgi:aspartate aminotransferase, mitochondrial